MGALQRGETMHNQGTLRRRRGEASVISMSRNVTAATATVADLESPSGPWITGEGGPSCAGGRQGEVVRLKGGCSQW